MVPSLQALYRLTRCPSLRGNPGRNVAYDLALEQFNNEVKNGLAATAKRPDIDPYIVILNGLRQVQEKLLAALGRDPDELEDRIPSSRNSDVQFLVEALKKIVPPESFFAPNNTNPFGSGAPWDDVTGTGRNGLRDFIVDELSKEPPPE